MLLNGIYYTKKALILFVSIILCTAVVSSCNFSDHSHKLTTTPFYDSLLERASILFDQGDTLHAFQFLDSITPLYAEANEMDKFRRYNNYADLYSNRLKDYVNAMLYADSMMSLVETKEMQDAMGTEYAHAYYTKGDVLFDIGDYEKAYDYYYKAKTISKDNGDTCIMAYYSYRLGMVLYRQQQYPIAISYFKQALVEGQKCRTEFIFFYRNQELLDNIGLCFNQLGQADSAIEYYQQALNYIEQQGAAYRPKRNAELEKAVGVIYGNMGTAYMNQNDSELAEKWLKLSIDINLRKGNDLLDAQYTRMKLANIYMKEGNYDEVFKITQQVREVLDRDVHDMEAEMRWNRLMAAYYKHTKQADIAYMYLSKYIDYKDSISARVAGLRGIDVDQRVKARDKEFQIALLEKKAEIKEAYLTLAILTTLLSLIIVVLIYQNSRKSRKNVELLTALNKRVQEQKAELEKSNKEKDRILKAVAHDVRSPINSVVALTELILSSPENISGEQHEFLMLINEACSNALELSKDILEAATSLKAENLRKEEVNMNQLLNNTLELLRPKASEKNQKITMQLLADNLHMYVDKGKISRVIGNLLTNAIKFSPLGSEIRVKMERVGDNLQISFKDNGIGIPDDMKDKIFDMFTEAKRPGTSGEKPYGLGMSISKHIIEAHNGKIWFTSQVDKGTVFYILLPLTEK